MTFNVGDKVCPKIPLDVTPVRGPYRRVRIPEMFYKDGSWQLNVEYRDGSVDKCPVYPQAVVDIIDGDEVRCKFQREPDDADVYVWILADKLELSTGVILFA